MGRDETCLLSWGIGGDRDKGKAHDKEKRGGSCLDTHQMIERPLTLWDLFVPSLSVSFFPSRPFLSSPSPRSAIRHATRQKRTGRVRDVIWDRIVPGRAGNTEDLELARDVSNTVSPLFRPQFPWRPFDVGGGEGKGGGGGGSRLEVSIVTVGDQVSGEGIQSTNVCTVAARRVLGQRWGLQRNEVTEWSQDKVEDDRFYFDPVWVAGQ